MKKLKGDGYYWSLLCYGVKGSPLICGVASERSSMVELGKEIKHCGGKHCIKKCIITIEVNEIPNKTIVKKSKRT